MNNEKKYDEVFINSFSLKQSDLDRLNTAFAKRDFFKILRGLENNLIDPTSSAYQRALRYKKVYDELY